MSWAVRLPEGTFARLLDGPFVIDREPTVFNSVENAQHVMAKFKDFGATVVKLDLTMKVVDPPPPKPLTTKEIKAAVDRGMKAANLRQPQSAVFDPARDAALRGEAAPRFECIESACGKWAFIRRNKCTWIRCHISVAKVACEMCGRLAGEPCKNLDGSPMSGDPHYDRKNAWTRAKKLTNGRRVWR